MYRLRGNSLKILSCFVISFMLIITSFSKCFAKTDNILDIKKSVESDLKNYIPFIDTNKEHFGLTNNDSVQNIVVNDGYEISKVSKKHVDDIVDKKVKAESSKFFVKNQTYVFPIFCNKKPMGIIIAENINGTYKIFKITSHISFVNDLNKAKGILNADDNSDTNIIYDEAYGLVGIASEESNSFIPIKSNNTRNLVAFKKKNLSDEMDDIIKEYKVNKAKSNENNVGGSVSNSGFNVPNISYKFLLSISVITLSAFVIIALKKKSYRV